MAHQAADAQMPPAKFKRRLSSALAEEYLELSQTQSMPEAKAESADLDEESQPRHMTLDEVYAEMKVAQEATNRQLQGHEARLTQLEATTIPLQIALTPWKCTAAEFWHSYTLLSNTEDMKALADTLQIGTSLDHFAEKVLLICTCSSKTASCVQQVRHIANSMGLPIFAAPVMHVSTKSLRRITKMISRSLATEYERAGIPMERPWLIVREPISVLKAGWSIACNTPERQESNQEATVLAKGTIQKIGEGSETYMKVELAQQTTWEGQAWDLTAWKSMLDLTALVSMPGFEFMVRPEWVVGPISPLETRVEKKETEATDKGKGGGQKGKGGGKGGSKGKGKGKSKAKDSFGNSVYAPPVKGGGKSGGKWNKIRGY